MSVSQQSLKASFRGIEFLMPDESEKGGKKNVIHEYPNSNKRFVEVLGVLQGVYSVTAIIHGGDAIQQRKRFKTALDEDGIGLLVHPTLGQINVVATDYTSSSSDTELGKFVFEITFVQSENNLTLAPTVASNQLLSSLANQGYGNLDTAFDEKYINNAATDTLKTTATKFNDILGQVDTLTNFLPDFDSGLLSVFKKGVNDAQNISAVVIRGGSNLSSTLRSNYNSFLDISQNISGYGAAWEALTNFSINRAPKSLITAKRITEENNLGVMDDHTRINALIGLYESSVYTQYNTDQDLLAAQDLLEERYDTLIQEAPDGSIAYDADLRQTINDMRVASRSVFEEKAQNVWKIVDIEPNQTSMALTAHRYYGDLDQINSLKNLNDDVNVAISDETLKGLT
tara:strand:- start:825 stop:2024 length:1200 start_codon:yes stop_codon:yes gene_type:complete